MRVVYDAETKRTVSVIWQSRSARLVVWAGVDLYVVRCQLQAWDGATWCEHVDTVDDLEAMISWIVAGGQ